MMLSYQATGGVTDWAARVPSAVLHRADDCSSSNVWARRLRPGMQLMAASSRQLGAGNRFGRGSVNGHGRLTALFTIAMLSCMAGISTEKRGWLCCFYLFLALQRWRRGRLPMLAGRTDPRSLCSPAAWTHACS